MDTSFSNHLPDPAVAGIGLRSDHYRAFAEMQPAVGFIEVHSENYFGDGGQPLAWLIRFRLDHAVSLHGVGLSLGSADGLDPRHLDKLERLVRRIEPALVSDHLCWGRIAGTHLNDLLPLPFTDEALAVVCRHVDLVQTRLKRRFLVENVSSYLAWQESSMAEAEFVAEVARRTGCGLLVDVNNIHVNAVNHGLDARAFLAALPTEAVLEIHLAGFSEYSNTETNAAPLLIDTHGAPVADDVWALYAEALARFGPVPTLIEWDTDIPALPVLLAEAATATRHLERHAARRVAA
ncbi:MAG: DUF692 domain-containing protein [Betaproteobacteria bacterium]|nr:DUF692 domain-containing protein [Betaproteobacteria bacterium]